MQLELYSFGYLSELFSEPFELKKEGDSDKTEALHEFESFSCRWTCELALLNAISFNIYL